VVHGQQKRMIFPAQTEYLGSQKRSASEIEGPVRFLFCTPAQLLFRFD
jgi:hypothetical protein